MIDGYIFWTDQWGRPVVSNGVNQGWQPAAELIRKDGDTSLFFLAPNTIYYTKQILDPVFAAIYTDSVPISGVSSNATYFVPTIEVSVIGCVDQYLILNPNNNRTTPVSGQGSLPAAIPPLQLNEAQSVTAQRIIQYFRYSDTYSSVFGAGDSALKAKDRVLGFKSLGVADNQWRIEVEGWFETSLAKIQAYAVEYASNTADLGRFGSVYLPLSNGNTTAAAEEQCRNQKIKSLPGYQTFSFFGVMFIAAAGVVIIVFALIVKHVVDWIRRRLKRTQSASATIYAANNKYQLQRMVLEDAGFDRQ